MRVLVTRPLLEAEATAQKLLALGHTPLIHPVFEVERLFPKLPKTQGLIVTSPRALHLTHATNLPVFKLTVDAKALAQEIEASPLTHFLWLTSDERAFDIQAALPQKHIEIVKAYAMHPLLPTLEGLDINAALHYSQKAAARTLQLLPNYALIKHYALSKRIASVFPPHCVCKVSLSKNEIALLQLL